MSKRARRSWRAQAWRSNDWFDDQDCHETLAGDLSRDDEVGGLEQPSRLRPAMPEPHGQPSGTADASSIAGDGRFSSAEAGDLLAHELRQPLFTIAMANESLRLLVQRSEPDRDQMRASVARIAEQVERAQMIIEHALLLASGRSRDRDEADVIASAAHAAHLLEERRSDSEVELIWQLPEGKTVVAANSFDLEQAFVNILRNAMDSIEDRRKGGWLGRGRIVVTIQQCGGDVRCTVADNGAGLVPSTIRDLFRPFFTTKEKGGTGLGLHICRSVINKAGGEICIKPRSLEGAKVEIRMPLVRHEAKA